MTEDKWCEYPDFLALILHIDQFKTCPANVFKPGYYSCQAILSITNEMLD